jgi:hypothetical protein
MGLQRNADATAAAIAARQHGVVTYEQLLWVGLTQSAIQRRIAKGRLHRLYRGVYAVGHRGLSREGSWKAATLACGSGAALSHRSAAELWGMLEPADGVIHVSIPAKGGRRTLEDLRREVTAGELRRALREAEFRRLPVDRFELVSDRAGSELELALLAVCRRHRLPSPEVNVMVGPFEVDFLWRRGRLVVETDGYDAHRGRVAALIRPHLGP